MLGWQLTGPLSQSVGASLSPSSRASFYPPAIRYLERADSGRPLRIEVAFTSSHWDADVLGATSCSPAGGSVSSTRATTPCSTTPRLTRPTYHAWLLANAVSYVALSSSARLLERPGGRADPRGGLPFLSARRPHRRDWRIYAVTGARPLRHRTRTRGSRRSTPTASHSRPPPGAGSFTAPPALHAVLDDDVTARPPSGRRPAGGRRSMPSDPATISA